MMDCETHEIYGAEYCEICDLRAGEVNMHMRKAAERYEDLDYSYHSIDIAASQVAVLFHLAEAGAAWHALCDPRGDAEVAQYYWGAQFIDSCALEVCADAFKSMKAAKLKELSRV